MGYNWSCDNCSHEESFGCYPCDVRDGIHRMCESCGQDGCVDCIPDTLCKTCRVEGCLATTDCVNPLDCLNCGRNE